MSYLHIDNLYKSQDILMFKEVYAMEKIHGCVWSRTKVLMLSGEEKPIRELKAGDFVVSFDENDQKFKPARINNVIVQEKVSSLAWYRLSFSNGRNLTCTEDHPVLTKNRGWVEAKDLREDDNIVEHESGRDTYSQRMVRKLNYYVNTICKYCGGKATYKKYSERHYEKHGAVCKKCVSKNSSRTLTSLRAKQTQKEKSSFGKFARSKVKDSGAAVRKQWQTVKADTDNYGEFCKKRSDRMKKVWEEYPEETRNHIVSKLSSSCDKARSDVSNDLKNKMISCGLYEGFVSEQVFHGFVPDEINHELKIIIEVFGDLYHCNPKKFKDPSKYITAIKRTVAEQRKRDEIKIAAYLRNGYSVLVIWEDDIRKRLDKVIERIKHEIDKKRKTV